MSNELPVNRIAAPPSADETIDLIGVAKLLRVHPVTVRRLIARNKFVRPFRAGVGLRWKRSDVDAWIAAGGTGRQLEVRSRPDREERRIASRRPVTARAGAGRRTITGYGAVFYRAGDPGTEYELAPGVFERIGPGAFDAALNDGGDVISLFNHSPDMLLGRTGAGTLRLSVDAVGLRYEVDLPNTSAGDDVWALAERGDLCASSFTFIPGESRKFQDGGRSVLERLTLELFELGPVVSPAYKATTAGATGDPGAADEPGATGGGRSRRDADVIAVTVALMDMEADDPPEPKRTARALGIGATRASGRAAPGSLLALIQSARADCRAVIAGADHTRVQNTLRGMQGAPGPRRQVRRELTPEDELDLHFDGFLDSDFDCEEDDDDPEM